MAVPKRKTTPSKRKMRRSHLGLSSINFVECPNCGELKLSHHICSSCGYYNKKSIVTMENLDENNQNSLPAKEIEPPMGGAGDLDDEIPF